MRRDKGAGREEVHPQELKKYSDTDADEPLREKDRGENAEGERAVQESEAEPEAEQSKEAKKKLNRRDKGRRGQKKNWRLILRLPERLYLNLFIGNASEVELYTLVFEKSQAVDVFLVHGDMIADLLFPGSVVEVADVEASEGKPGLEGPSRIGA
jgi:hypothetical protein